MVPTASPPLYLKDYEKIQAVYQLFSIALGNRIRETIPTRFCLLDVKDAVGQHVNAKTNVSWLANAQSVETRRPSSMDSVKWILLGVCVDKTMTFVWL